MMSPGEKLVAVGMLGTITLMLGLVSGYFAAASLFVTVPFATVIYGR